MAVELPREENPESIFESCIQYAEAWMAKNSPCRHIMMRNSEKVLMLVFRRE
jgi:hypothetical protein